MGVLYVIAEGEAHTLEYLNRNGLYPHIAVWEAYKFKELIPYLPQDADILLVLNGLTTFSLAAVYELLSDLEGVKAKVNSVTVLSNLDLGVVPYDYYKYTGDLFYGAVYEKVDKAWVAYNPEVESKTSKKKGVFRPKHGEAPEIRSENFSINAVMRGYSIYNDRKVKVTIHGKTNTEIVPLFRPDDNLASKIIIVDAFKDKNQEGDKQ